MKKNLGQADRIIRVVIAVILVTLAFMNVITGYVAVILSTISVVFVLTSFISFCPIYWSLGLSTLKKKSNVSH